MDIRKLNEVIKSFSGRMEEELGGELFALHLFGSVMIAGDYHHGISDINTFVVFSDGAGVKAITKASRTYKEFKKYPFAIPLMMKAKEIKEARDVFPVELLEIKERNRLLCGTDILEGIDFSMEDIRAQCEMEIRAKIIGLRKMLFAGDELVKHQEVLYKSLTSTVVLLKQILRLKNRPLPETRGEIIDSLETLLDRKFDGIKSLYNMRTKSEKITKNIIENLVANYLKELEFFSGIFNEKI